MDRYDYIILGAGASGLMLAFRMSQDTFYDDKSILIIDKIKDKGNDRTWCYWEKKDGEWDHLLSKSWPKIYFGSQRHSEIITISPYDYKMIRSEKLYQYFWKAIGKKSNFKFISDTVVNFYQENEEVRVKTENNSFTCAKLFNSIPNPKLLKDQKEYPVLQQHFLGWFIKTEEDCFDDTLATFMDFNIPQNGNTRFMYILPLDKRTALFEYTLFSENLLPNAEYETAIKDYLDKKNITDYKITETEKGSIPMTCFKFSKFNSKHILNIGTVGGWTKASTGYTFLATTKNTKRLVEFLKSESDLSKFAKRTKFWYYDLLMLDVLANDNGYGATMFSSLFKNSNVETIFKFLDEESSIIQDLKIITSVPPIKFMTALFKRLV